LIRWNPSGTISGFRKTIRWEPPSRTFNVVCKVENQNLEFRGEFYNVTNTRNFNIPESRLNSANFANQWGTTADTAAFNSEYGIAGSPAPAAAISLPRPPRPQASVAFHTHACGRA
jgi:hypothetical protein